tara:strand:+ start:623 stop:802 length:180 start_codon:yes stop_codon:yes gene_type:complete
MSKKYKLKDKLMPRRPSFLGLETSDWYELNAGNEVEIKKLPDLAKKYLEEVKSKSKEVK